MKNGSSETAVGNEELLHHKKLRLRGHRNSVKDRCRRIPLGDNGRNNLWLSPSLDPVALAPYPPSTTAGPGGPAVPRCG